MVKKSRKSKTLETIEFREKYYCGSRKVGAPGWDYASDTVEGVVEAARRILDNEPRRLRVYIVEVIGVVEAQTYRREAKFKAVR